MLKQNWLNKFKKLIKIFPKFRSSSIDSFIIFFFFFILFYIPINILGDGFINYFLDPNEIRTPLKELLFNNIYLEFLILISVLILAYLFYKNNNGPALPALILIAKEKAEPADDISLDTKIAADKKDLDANQINKILFYLVFAFIIICIGIHIRINTELFLNTEDFVEVHQYLISLNLNAQDFLKKIYPSSYFNCICQPSRAAQ